MRISSPNAFWGFPGGWSFILTRRMQYIAPLKLYWLLLAVALAVVVPAGLAQVQTDIASSSLPDAPAPQQNTPTTAPATPPPVSTSASQADAQDAAKKKQQ